MPRLARVVIDDLPHHITQRGNGRQQIFACAADYQLYLSLLRHYCEHTQVRLWGYCLMPNHVHLIVVPRDAHALASALGRTHARFAQHFNMVRERSGHVWQARYYSCPMDQEHLWRALVYVERNPVRAGLTKQAEAYQWSSAAAHLRGRDALGFLDLAPWRLQYTEARWAKVLQTSVDDEALGERLHEATRLGRPLGSVGFIADLESQTGRILQPKPPGRRAKAAGIGD